MLNESAFCDVLAQLRVSGAVVLSHRYQVPWAIDVPSAKQLVTLLGVDTQATIVPFHIVTRGWLDYIPESGEKIRVESGQFIVCMNGNGHSLVNGKPDRTYAFGELIYREEQDNSCAGDSGQTAILCGAFLLRNTRNNPLINALPDVLHVDAIGQESTFAMQQIYRLFVNELHASHCGKNYMLERLLEVMYTESVRDYVSKHPGLSGNWLSALSDQRVSAALNYIHKNISADITVSLLADEVHMSASRFAALFKQAVGLAPIKYIANWRMQLAANKLSNSTRSVGQIAEQAGYASAAAFNHAFNRAYNCSPASWRKNKKGSDQYNVTT